MSPFNVFRSIMPGLSNGKGATSLQQAPAVPSDEDIARRAYEKFLARGGEHGFDRDDWDDARRDLLAEARVISHSPPGHFDA